MIRLEKKGKKDSRRMEWEHGWEHGEGAGKPDPRRRAHEQGTLARDSGVGGPFVFPLRGCIGFL